MSLFLDTGIVVENAANRIKTTFQCLLIEEAREIAAIVMDEQYKEEVRAGIIVETEITVPAKKDASGNWIVPAEPIQDENGNWIVPDYPPYDA